ncbi:MAG: hypothetical protein KC619_18450 [Myxococcales bacterium]|nr:hypothetical protein [Myxococcales bacterium]
MHHAPTLFVTPPRRISTHLVLGILCGATLLVSTSAEAQIGRALDRPAVSAPTVPEAASPLDGWSLDLTAQTSLPISVGIEAQLQTPIGLFATLSVGHTPNAYLSMLADVVQGTGAFGDDIRPLIDEGIANGAWNVRVGVGLNPIEGLELSFGYTYLGANSTVTRRAIESATGQRIPYRGMNEAPLGMEMHALHGRIGYRFLVEDHLVIRAAIGWTHGIGMSAHLDVPDEVRAIDGNPATEIEEGVASSFGQYGFTPELLVSAGYRF